MSFFKAELNYYLRSPLIWLVMALSSFVSAWAFLYFIDLFTSLQVKFSNMSDAPTLIQGILNPLLVSQTKLLLLIVPIVAGLSFSRYFHNNGWSLIKSNQQPLWKLILEKYGALLLVSLVFILPALLMSVSLIIMAKMPVVVFMYSVIALSLLLMWLTALALYISSLVNNSGFAILLCLLVFILLLMLGQNNLDASWGKNWLQVVSPFYHFKQILKGNLPWSSLVYYISGSIIWLAMLRVRLIHKRYVLV